MPDVKSPMIKIGLLGVRDFRKKIYDNLPYVTERMDEFLAFNRLKPEQVEIITGGGHGVEALGLKWAESHNIPTRCIPPNIKEYGAETAFTIRNNHVVSSSDLLVIFWDGCIKITQEAIVNAMHRERTVMVYPLR